VSMFGRLGDDAFATTLRAGLRANGVDDTHVLNTPGSPSGVAWISVDDVGANAITVIPGANGCVTADDVARWSDAIAECDVVLVQLEIPLPAVAAVVQLARRHGRRVVLDVAPVPTEPLPDELWQVDVLSPNQTEAELLTEVTVDSVNAAKQAATVLLSRGPRCVVLKLGELGALIAEPGGVAEYVPAYRVTPVDTTAAGDAFTAALAVALAEGQSLADAARFGCAAGACATLRFGAQPAMPTREDVLRMMTQ
ncbi:MAG: PfkB family carbohydrate kinase, partial [Planctomycetaceae bacterium]|nr:PfkB family carbohydrate kinase [Planctomycetaceae bacterium]